MKNIKLFSKRLCLREYQPDDIDRHHGLISDAVVMENIQDVFSHSYQESLDNLNFAIAESKRQPRSKYFLVIADKVTNQYLGGIGYEVVSSCPAGKQVDIGYFLYPQYQGKGYASEALRRLIEFAFTKDDVYRINGTCITTNVASARVMESCGMTREAELIDIEWHIDRLKSRYLYRLLHCEWNDDE